MQTKLNWRQRANRAAAFALVSAPLLVTKASAALPTELTTEMGNAEADALLAVAAVGAMMVVVAVAAAAWRIGIKGIKRLGGAA